MNDHDQPSPSGAHAAARSEAPRRKRRFLRIGLRTFLALLTISCVWLGWKARRAHLQRKAVEAIREADGIAYYDYQWVSDDLRVDYSAPKPGPDWLRNKIGIDYLADVVAVDESGDPFRDPLENAIVDLSPLANLSHVELVKLHVRDNDLSSLADLKRLRSLSLDFASDLERCDLSPLRNAADLRRISLQGDCVDDISPLAKLRLLEALTVSSSNLHDLSPLTKLTQLKVLYLHTSDSDLSPLSSLTNLRDLGLQVTSANDLSPLADLTQLQKLHLVLASASDTSASFFFVLLLWKISPFIPPFVLVYLVYVGFPSGVFLIMWDSKRAAAKRTEPLANRQSPFQFMHSPKRRRSAALECIERVAAAGVFCGAFYVLATDLENNYFIFAFGIFYLTSSLSYVLFGRRIAIVGAMFAMVMIWLVSIIEFIDRIS